MEKKKTKKKNKKNKKRRNILSIIILTVVALVIIFNALFIYIDDFYWNCRCNVVVGRITHIYAGRVYISCSAVDCEGTEKYVFGRLPKKEYRELKKEIREDSNWICYYFE